jgi:hypothetical protein
MNPLLVIGGLGILGFALMGLKKKPTSTSSTYIPFGPDIAPIPDWIREQEEADSGMFRYNIPGRVA